jgi:hypothetical protein
LWAERWLDFPLSVEESWRLASYELFREKAEEYILKHLPSAADLRPSEGEDPESHEYQARLMQALKEGDRHVVGAVFCYGSLQLRMATIVVSDEERSAGRVLYNLDRLPTLSRTPAAHLEKLNHARLAIVAHFLEGSGLNVQSTGKFDPQFSLTDPLRSRTGRFS